MSHAGGLAIREQWVPHRPRCPENCPGLQAPSWTELEAEGSPASRQPPSGPVTGVLGTGQKAGLGARLGQLCVLAQLSGAGASGTFEYPEVKWGWVRHGVALPPGLHVMSVHLLFLL